MQTPPRLGGGGKYPGGRGGGGGGAPQGPDVEGLSIGALHIGAI